ncbi:MAG: hypothetical protein HY567_01990 [Candidatus Kerfeldbacteria bacterium]|nr:hypothetical protein [Candidatus Kerfeldbacteria bacterium]
MVLINFIQRHQKPTAVILAVVLLSAFWLAVPHEVKAVGEGIIANILSWLAYQLITLMANLLVVVVNILVAVAQYNNFLGAPAVERGWVIVRDIANMFFIVVLLIIAFGTILRLENYRYNRLLARLIVMAILVNFSKFIAGFFIDFGQVIMLTFVNAWRDVAAGNITHALGLTEIIQLRNQPLPSGQEISSGAVLTALLLGLFLVTVAVIVLAIMAIVLILRVLALWFLVVLSPLAYLFRTYPATEKYAARWWQEFGRYVVVGPVMAFLLWLSLAVMTAPVQFSEEVFTVVKTTEGSAVIEPTDSATANNVAAAISTIGQSDKLLGYITGIMLLVGTLMITRELGVAGGQLAGQWAEKIRGFATKAAVVGGAGAAFGALGVAGVTVGRPAAKLAGKGIAAGAKGLGNAIIDRAQVALGGIPLRPSVWAEGFKRASARRRHDWEEKRWQAANKNMEEALKPAVGKKMSAARRAWKFAVGAAGSPEYFKYNLLTFGNFGKMIAGRGGEVLGGDFSEASEDYNRTRERAKAMARERELMQGSRDLGQFYVQETAGQRVQSDVNAEAEKIRSERTRDLRADVNFFEEKDHEGKVVRRLPLAEYISGLMRDEGYDPTSGDERTVRRRAALEKEHDEQLARSRLVKEEQQGQLTAKVAEVAKDRAANPASRYGRKTVKKDKEEVEVSFADALDEAMDKKFPKNFNRYLESQGIDPRAKDDGTKLKIEALRPGYEAIFKKEFEDNWNKEQAEAELELSPEYQDPMATREERYRQEILKSAPENELRRRGQAVHEEEVKKLRDQAAAIRAGGLTEGQHERREKELIEVIKKLEQIDKDLKTHSPGTPEYSRLMEERAEREKQRQLLERYLKPKPGEKPPLNDDEKKEGEKEAEKLEEAANLQEGMAKRRVTDTELRLMDEAIDAQEKKVRDQAKVVSRLRPAVPKELRRELRASIAEKKKEITTEQWQEQLSIFEDAVRRGDASTAAAAGIRAAEDFNLNEFQTNLGYDSDAEGLKQMIDDYFIGKLGMSEDQALSIANDMSHAAEKVNHWGVARAVKTDTVTGRQHFQDELDREMEVSAEIRKGDFEGTIRRFNRLAWGKEVIGAGTDMERASPAERAEYYRQTGDRSFVSLPYGLAFLAENFGKSERNIKTGRFNPNYATKLFDPANRQMLEMLVKALGNFTQLGDSRKVTMPEILALIRQFGARDRSAAGDFDRLRDFWRRSGR